MENMNTHSVNYNNINIFIDINGNKSISVSNKKTNLNTLSITLTKENNTKLYLGIYYAILPTILTDFDLKELVREFIDNIDIITFDCGKYIGKLENGIITRDINIVNYLIDKNVREYDVKLKDIYLEFFDLKEKSLEYRKYSCFLELEFISHGIPDNIKSIFLKRNNKSIIDYNNNELDEEMKSDFKNDLYENEWSFDLESNKEKLKKIKAKINKYVGELKTLETIIDNIIKALNKIDNNLTINNEIYNLDQKISKLGMFSKDKKIFIKKKSDLLKEIKTINMEEEITILKNEISCFPFIKISSYNSINDIHDDVFKIYDKKNIEYDKLKDQYDNLYNKIEKYKQNKIDISELRDRLDN